MNTILVPLDGSPLAEQVLPYVRVLAPLLHASVRLLHVVSDGAVECMLADENVSMAEEEQPMLPHALREQHAWATLRAQAEECLESQATQLRADGLEVMLTVRQGAPLDTILAVALGMGCSLIAMATHGRSGLRRWALGSVADKVVRGAPTPVLVVRSGAPLRAGGVRRILVPLDGSDAARQALPQAVELATAAQAELILFQAITPTLMAYPYTPLPGAVLDALREQACQELGDLATQLRAHYAAVTSTVAVGHPADAIVDAAARRHADLVVMATHGYGGLRRWALGSVADKVLHTTLVPLLLVRSKPRVDSSA